MCLCDFAGWFTSEIDGVTKYFANIILMRRASVINDFQIGKSPHKTQLQYTVVAEQENTKKTEASAFCVFLPAERTDGNIRTIKTICIKHRVTYPYMCENMCSPMNKQATVQLKFN